MSNELDNPWLDWASTQEAALGQATGGTLNVGNEYRNIWVFSEVKDGFVSGETKQVFYKARELGDLLGARVQAVLLGTEVEPLAKDLIGYGADTVMVAEHPMLAGMPLEAATKALGQLVDKYKPEIFLFAATRLAEDLAPRLALRVGTGFIADAIDLELDDAERLLRVTRSAFSGKLQTTSVIGERKPQIATLRPGVYREADFDRFRPGEVATVEVDLTPGDRPTRVVETRPNEGASLENARILVAGGKGVGDAETWKLVEALAEALGGVVGATKGAVAAGWASPDRQIGLAGKKVKPDLYVAVGISGSLDHQGGMAQARNIVTVNTDREAPIVALSDYAMVGDLKEILPAWIKALHERQGKKQPAGVG